MSNPAEKTPASSNQPPPPAPPSRLRRLGKKLLALLISTLIALFIAEIAIRFLAPQVMVVPMTETLAGLQVQRPNVDGRGYVPRLYDVTYRTNSQRFRGQREYPQQPTPGTTRIIAIGDSLCFGVGADDDQSFPAVLEKSLQSANQKIEVINAGIGGTGTGSQALWFDNSLSQLKPKIVVLSIFVNDIDDDFASPYFTLTSQNQAIPIAMYERLKRVEQLEKARKRVNAIPGYSFLAEHSHLVNLIRRIASRSMSGEKTAPKTAEQIQKQHDRFIAQGVPLFDAELAWLKERVESAGCQLVIAWFPCRETIYPDTGAQADEFRWQANEIIKALQSFSTKTKTPLLEPTNIFKQKAATSPTELYYKGADWHPNPDGYRLFGEELSTFLLKSGLLPNSK